MRLQACPARADQPLDEDAFRRQLTEEGFRVVRWSDAAGAIYAPHAHQRDESLWILDGEIVFTIASRDYRLRPADRLMLPKGTIHSAHAGPHGAVYLIGERP
jgi:quercetin dioxygenase-like cupin family protein